MTVNTCLDSESLYLYPGYETTAGDVLKYVDNSRLGRKIKYEQTNKRNRNK